MSFLHPTNESDCEVVPDGPHQAAVPTGLLGSLHPAGQATPQGVFQAQLEQGLLVKTIVHDDKKGLLADILNVKKFTQTLFFSLKFYPRVRDYNQPKCLTKQRKLLNITSFVPNITENN